MPEGGGWGLRVQIKFNLDVVTYSALARCAASLPCSQFRPTPFSSTVNKIIKLENELLIIYV